MFNTPNGWVYVPREGNECRLELIKKNYIWRDSKREIVLGYDEDDGGLYVPRSFLNTSLSKETKIIAMEMVGRELGDIVFGNKFKYRPRQKDAVERCVASLRKNNGCILKASPGKGKTVMGAAIAASLGYSTCVLVHKEFLYEQWIKAFELVAPSLKVGLMQRDTVDTGHECDVVCAITQSVTNPKRNYPNEFFNSFGLLISDEIHRYASEIWKTAITKFPAKYRLGLSAEDTRADGLWCIIESHIGQVEVSLDDYEILPVVYQIPLDTKINPKKYNLHWLNDTQKRAKILTELASDERRNNIISLYILKAWKQKRKILIISDRKAQIESLSGMLQARGVPEDQIGFYIGGKKMEVLNEYAERPVIFGTYGMANEGLDIPSLDVLVMATPRTRTVQITGRLLRSMPGKKQPIVLDFVDYRVPLLKKGATGRLWGYRKSGFQVIDKQV